MSAAELSEVAMAELLPTGTVTLLLADVEESTRLWDTQPEAMTAAIARFNRTVTELVATHGGVRPVEQGEGDSFVAAFARASDAVTCALALQLADLSPIKLRIGVHSGEIQLRDEGNYVGPTINKTARLRDLAHGGQTLLSSVAAELVEDRLPDGAWLTDLGRHPLLDLPRPIEVTQLCHPDLRTEFPPLRNTNDGITPRLPAQLTTFVGRRAQLVDLNRILADNRLVTLTGAGGAGKTRLAIEVAGRIQDRFRDRVFYADLAPVAHAEVVPVTVARAFGLPDQPGRSTTDTLLRFVRKRDMLLVLDNCEHLLSSTATLVESLMAAGPSLTILTTSREPLLVAGEVNWQVPSLSLEDEAMELFADRARRARPEFLVGESNSQTVKEICRRLDGMPLAIELAAARVRTLTLAEILNGLHDRFRLLTGGARTAVRRQQTLRASVDWSHALLTQPERVLFRRLAVFMGGFDLDAAQAVAGGAGVERFQVLDQLSLLVDKSLVIAENADDHTRYRLLETVRQYALEKLGESGEANDVRTRHRDHYGAMAAELDAPSGSDYGPRLTQAVDEMDNLRAAFTWSLENDENAEALELASSLQPLWLTRGRISEGLAWLDAAAAEGQVEPTLWARAIADKAVLRSWVDITGVPEQAERALRIARELDDPGLLVRVLTGCACINAHHGAVALPYFTEAAELAREMGDSWRLSQILGRQSTGGLLNGDVTAAQVFGERGRTLADAIGDDFNARQCRMNIAWAHMCRGQTAAARSLYGELIAEARQDHDVTSEVSALIPAAFTLAFAGDVDAAREAAAEAIEACSELGFLLQNGYFTLVVAELAAGDPAAAMLACEVGLANETNAAVRKPMLIWAAQAALGCGRLGLAREWVDEALPAGGGVFRCLALAASARIHIAGAENDHAATDAYEGLSLAASLGAYLCVPDYLECLAEATAGAANPQHATRLLGAASAIRQNFRLARFKVFSGGYHALTERLRNSVEGGGFDAAWVEGAELSPEEAVSFALRGRGERKRPSSGWESLTPTELDVVRLLRDGLSNKDIAERLFISPRTVQSHLRHVYNKVGLTSRVQLAQEATRH